MTAPASSEQMPARGHAALWLGLTFILILLIAAAPTLVSFAGAGIAGALGCEGSMEIKAPCLFQGNDISQTLTTMIYVGYLSFVTFPFGACLLAIWAVVACVVAIYRWRRRGAA
jgi:hypothetical protein